jgi:hypothetical protein
MDRKTIMIDVKDFNNFIKFHEKNEEEAISLIKSWLSDNSPRKIQAINFICKQLSVTQISRIIPKFSERERDEWKSIVDVADTAINEDETVAFISEEIIRHMIFQKSLDDVELLDMILNMRDGQFIMFFEKHPEESRILVNMVGPTYLAKILDYSDPELAERVIADALTFDFAEVTDGNEAFKATLKEFLDEFGLHPFYSKMINMLGLLDNDKETLIFKRLSEGLSSSQLVDIASTNFPLEALWSLPKNILSEILLDFPLKKKARLISCQSDTSRIELLRNSCAAEGSTAREMLDLETDIIDKNPANKARCQSQQKSIEKDFLAYVRQYLSTHPNIKPDLRLSIDQWVKSLNSASKEKNGRLAA